MSRETLIIISRDLSAFGKLPQIRASHHPSISIEAMVMKYLSTLSVIAPAFLSMAGMCGSVANAQESAVILVHKHYKETSSTYGVAEYDSNKNITVLLDVYNAGDA